MEIKINLQAAMATLANSVTSKLTADESLKVTQAILNLAHAECIIANYRLIPIKKATAKIQGL